MSDFPRNAIRLEDGWRLVATAEELEWADQLLAAADGLSATTIPAADATARRIELMLSWKSIRTTCADRLLACLREGSIRAAGLPLTRKPDAKTVEIDPAMWCRLIFDPRDPNHAEGFGEWGGVEYEQIRVWAHEPNGQSRQDGAAMGGSQIGQQPPLVAATIRLEETNSTPLQTRPPGRPKGGRYDAAILNRLKSWPRGVDVNVSQIAAEVGREINGPNVGEETLKGIQGRVRKIRKEAFQSFP